MEFDRWTILLLRRRRDAPARSESEKNTLQDSHLAFLARLHAQGHLLAAGPVQGPAGSDVAGVCIYRGTVDEARSRAANDPAVRAGEFDLEPFSWWVPEGAVRFETVRFPHSMAEVDAK
jgi:hypothetical protein